MCFVRMTRFAYVIKNLGIISRHTVNRHDISVINFLHPTLYPRKSKNFVKARNARRPSGFEYAPVIYALLHYIRLNFAPGRYYPVPILGYLHLGGALRSLEAAYLPSSFCSYRLSSVSPSNARWPIEYYPLSTARRDEVRSK